MKKLSRKEIQEGLKSVPIERIMLGASNPSNIRLTKKQKTFAEELVKTGNKTEAYRRSYDTNGKRETASRDAQKIANNPKVNTYVMAMQSAKEVEEYLLPSRLRTMAIHKLSNMALNDDLPPAQQLKALELIGKMSEVSLFTHRAEVIHTVDSNSLRVKLMEAIQVAIQRSQSIHVKTKRSAQELLDEINNVDEPIDVNYVDHDDGTDTHLAICDDTHAHTDAVAHPVAHTEAEVQGILTGDGDLDGGIGEAHTPTPLDTTTHDQLVLHSIPHIKSPENTPPTINTVNAEIKNNSTDTHPLDFIEKKGEGGI
jgi:phage terminase small subunit